MDEPPQQAAERQQAESDLHRIREEQEKVERIKAAITAQMEQGTAPQYMLFGAIDCIETLTHDAGWGEPLKEKLNAIYHDLAQESLFADNAAIAAERLKKQQSEHNARLRRELTRQIAKQTAIEAALRGALRSLDELENPGGTSL
jgi:hypothetical protein